MTMVERVAAAITKAFEGEWRVFDAGQAEILAAAAIEAMREPTEAMVAAAPEEGVTYDKHAQGFAANYYTAMIDAALRDRP